MRNVNRICMSVFMLGAAAIAAPALAQEEQAAPAEQAAPEPAANAPAQAPAPANESAKANADTSAGPAAASGNSQIAMNSAGATAAANANVSSVGDTSKKYHRASRAKDFAAEQKVTQQLNQMASNAAKPGVQTAMNQ